MAELSTAQLTSQLGTAIGGNPGLNISVAISNTNNIKEFTNADPSVVIPDAKKAEYPATNLTFPKSLVGVKNGQDSGAYMQITCFKYQRGYRDLAELDEPVTEKKKQYTIRLPMPQTVSQEYSADLDQFTGSAVFDLAQEASKDLMGDGGSAILGGAASMGAVLARETAARFMAGAGFNTNGAVAQAFRQQKNLWSSAAGINTNPRYEMAFNSMNIRQHSFDFNLIPTDKDEADTIRELIQKLRISSHPKAYIESLGLMYEYPDEFIITFHDQKGRRMLDVPYIPDCVIKDMGVSHTTGRLHTDGTVVATRLTLQFQELQAMDQSDIKRIAGHQ